MLPVPRIYRLCAAARLCCYGNKGGGKAEAVAAQEAGAIVSVVWEGGILSTHIYILGGRVDYDQQDELYIGFVYMRTAVANPPVNHQLGVLAQPLM